MQRAVVLSVALHLVLAAVASVTLDPSARTRTELVDIEVAPEPPEAEALPPEVARPPEELLAGKPEPVAPASELPTPGEGFAIDAGVDAPLDAAPDAPPAPVDAPRAPKDAPPDAELDAAAPLVAVAEDAGGLDGGAPDGGTDGGTGIAQVPADLDDAGPPRDAIEVATIGTDAAAAGAGSGAAGAGAGSGSGVGAASIAIAAGSGSGVAGQTDEPAVAGAPTTAGTAANLLTYFPQGHVVTALIRFDRLRGTEWAAQTERLLRPMPDYRVLFGPADARIGDKLDTLVISTPSPRDATATTLVAHTALGRPALRTFLAATTPVTWSTARGGMLGKRTGKTFPGDARVFLSPFRGWFLLAQPGDLGPLTTPVRGKLDAIEARGKLPAWLASVRKIEEESGADKRGPALVVTLALGGQRIDLQGNDFGLGIASVPTPDRVSLAMELVPQGWLVRGNMRFASDKEASELIAIVEAAKQLVGKSSAIKMVLGKPLARVIDNLSFARTGARVSYATSISIADARAILAMTAQQLDQYYAGADPKVPGAP